MWSHTTQRKHWAHIRIGACALLLPPLTLGAALYSMLTAPDEGTARPPVAAAGAPAVRPELLRGTIQPSNTDPQPAAQATQPVADEPAPPIPATGARHAAGARSAFRRRPTGGWQACTSLKSGKSKRDRRGPPERPGAAPTCIFVEKLAPAARYPAAQHARLM